MDGGNPRKTGASPAATATSRCASAKRVIESARNNTDFPSSRKCSATAMAAQAQRRLTSGDWSEVAATTIALSRPFSPNTSSTKWRTSRPLSPIIAMTTISALIRVANSPIRLDLPTPDPANRPILCPLTKGSMVSNTMCPVCKRPPIALRCAAGGGDVRKGRGTLPRGSGFPSNGCPSGSTIRPTQL